MSPLHTALPAVEAGGQASTILSNKQSRKQIPFPPNMHGQTLTCTPSSAPVRSPSCCSTLAMSVRLRIVTGSGCALLLALPPFSRLAGAAE